MHFRLRKWFQNGGVSWRLRFVLMIVLVVLMTVLFKLIVISLFLFLVLTIMFRLIVVTFLILSVPGCLGLTFRFMTRFNPLMIILLLSQTGFFMVRPGIILFLFVFILFFWRRRNRVPRLILLSPNGLLFFRFKFNRLKFQSRVRFNGRSRLGTGNSGLV